MEGKNNNHPSLPSNYVTLAQLQQRWLSKQKHKDNEKEKEKEKEKEMENEKEKKLQQQQKQKQKQPLTNLPHHNNPREYRQGQRPKAPQPTWRAISPHAAVKPSPEKSTPKNPDVAVEAEIGDGNDGHDGRKKQRNKHKKKAKRKPRAEDATESSTVVENIEVSNCDFKRTDEKTETEIEKKISMNSEHEKQNSKVKRNGSGGRNYRNGKAIIKVNKKLAEHVVKSVMVDESESDNLMSEVEQKLGKIAMNSENVNEKLNSSVVMCDRSSSHGSQRNNGGGKYSSGPFGRVDKERKKLAANAAQWTMVGNKEVENLDVQRGTKVELNGCKSDDLVSEFELNVKQKNNRGVRMYDGYRGFQRRGPYGGGIRAHEDQKIWVRKSEDSNGNVDNNVITSK